LVDTAVGGWVSIELEALLGVRVHAALLTLYRRGRLLRHQIGGEYLYVSVSRGSAQVEHRQHEVQAQAAPAWKRTSVPSLKPFWRPSTKSNGACMPGLNRCAWVAAATPSSPAGLGSMSRPWPGDGKNCRPVA